MLPRIDSRVYTNSVLTIIAVLLAAGALREYRVQFTTPAYAQTSDSTRDGFSRNVRQAPTDVSNVPQTQDLAVAAATSEVAAANREIAAAIRELATSIESAGSSIRSAIPQTGTSGDAAPAASRPASSERPVVEVAP